MQVRQTITRSLPWRTMALRGTLALAMLCGATGCLLQTDTPATTTEPPPVTATNAPAPAAAAPSFLPPQALDTLALIRRGGPYPHPQDDEVFFNREGHLPSQPRGHYREYTVETPGLNHRGARRIVTGGQPPRRYYYTDDHYESFREFTPFQ